MAGDKLFRFHANKETRWTSQACQHPAAARLGRQVHRELAPYRRACDRELARECHRVPATAPLTR
jgi:hypothetical protein